MTETILLLVIAVILSLILLIDFCTLYYVMSIAMPLAHTKHSQNKRRAGDLDNHAGQ